MQEPKPFGPQLPVHAAEAGDVAARPVEAGDEADLDVESFTTFALARGWGDGLPMIPPRTTTA